MLYTREVLRRAMRRFYAVDPESVLDLAENGPMEEPFCCVCSMLLPVVNDRLPGHRAAATILDYHDELTYGIGRDWNHEDDYAWAIGLTQVLTYHRCLHVYEEANRLIDESAKEVVSAALKGV